MFVLCDVSNVWAVFLAGTKCFCRRLLQFTFVIIFENWFKCLSILVWAQILFLATELQSYKDCVAAQQQSNLQLLFCSTLRSNLFCLLTKIRITRRTYPITFSDDSNVEMSRKGSKRRRVQISSSSCERKSKTQNDEIMSERKIESMLSKRTTKIERWPTMINNVNKDQISDNKRWIRNPITYLSLD